MSVRKQSEAALDLEHAAHRGVETRRRDASGLQRSEHRDDGRIGVGGHQQEVRSRLERADRRIARAVFGDDAAHHQRIGHDESMEAQRIA